ncbi:MAG TPA: AAA family ATPase [Thermomicrobiales bacterium]|nr:AAA family ATPase [Thermomicrobiales bacterium]
MENLSPDGVAPDDAANLTIGLLGGFRVQVGRREVADSEWRLRKARSLVKLLALAPGRQLHREQLLETLWPEQDPDAAANNLHKAVYIARRALEPDLAAARWSRYLHLQGDSLVLRPPGTLTIDIDEFERATATALRSGDPAAYDDAVALYAGDLLPEDRYEDWAAARRDELRACCLSLWLALAGLREARGEPAAAVEALRRLVADDPAHEEAHVALTHLHALAGRRHQALRQDQQLRDGLRRELDADPAPSSDRLYQDILAGRLTPAAGADPGPMPSIAPGDGGAERATALVGRDAEIEAIEDRLDAAFAARGGVVLIAGEAGIGKSRLVAEIAERVRGARESSWPAPPMSRKDDCPTACLPKRWPLGGLTAAGGLRAILGDDASDFARFPQSAQSALRADRQRLFAAIADLLRRQAAGAPILLVLEDLHAADHASLQLLHFLARMCRDSRMLIVGTFRPEDASPTDPLPEFVAALRRERLAVRIDLRRLDPRENGLFVAALLDDAPADRVVAATVFRLTAGNPLYASEVVQALRDGDRLRRVDGRWRLAGEATPPGPLLALLAVRLERLGPLAMRTLGVAAAAGAEVSFALLRAASDLPESEALDVLDRCLARGALLETPTGYRFDHPLRRMAVYERLGRARRTSLHGRIAAALEDLHAGRLAEQAEALGRHWALSERPVAAGDARRGRRQRIHLELLDLRLGHARSRRAHDRLA